LGAKASQTLDIGGYSVIREIAAHDLTKPLPLHGHRQVASLVQRLAYRFERRPHSFLRGQPVEQEFPRLRLPADMRESEKVEGLRLPLPSFTTVRRGQAAEAHQPCLLGMHFQSKALQALLELSPEPDCVGLMLETQHEVVGVAHDDDLAARTLSPLLYPEVEHVMEVYIRKKR
jgi:hypothetical protein